MLHEKERLNLYANNLNLIEKGLKLIKIQYRFRDSRKRIDMLCEDSRHNLVVIEEKARKLSSKRMIDQVIDYCELLTKENSKSYIRAVLIAPEITDKAMKYLESISKYNMTFHSHDFITDGYLPKMLKVSEKAWKTLIIIKLRERFRNVDEVINYLLKQAKEENATWEEVIKTSQRRERSWEK